MLKPSLVLVALVLVAFGATQATAMDFDQKSFYGQGVLAMPIGDWSDFVNVGFGAGLGILVPHTQELSFRGEVSYLYHSTDSDFFGDDADVSASQLPILALVQYDLADNPFYLLGGLGFNILTVDVEYDTRFGRISSDDSSTELNLALGGGYAVNESFSLEARFNVVSDANSLSAHGVFHF